MYSSWMSEKTDLSALRTRADKRITMRKTWRRDEPVEVLSGGPYRPEIGRARPSLKADVMQFTKPWPENGTASEWLFAKGGMCVVVLGALMGISVAAVALVPHSAAVAASHRSPGETSIPTAVRP